MIQEFSAGYYLKTYWIQRTKEVDSVKINNKEYKALEEYGYEDIPLIVKLKNNRFIVEGNDETPVQTLEVNSEDVEDLNFDRNPSKENVLLPKPSIVSNFYL